MESKMSKVAFEETTGILLDDATTYTAGLQARGIRVNLDGYA